MIFDFNGIILLHVFNKISYNVYTGEKLKTSQKGQEITLKGIQPILGDITVIAVELNKNVR